jgi:pimeloyl-ACP methyl ester carboxylesterase
MKKLILFLLICIPFLTFAHGFDELEISVDAKGAKLSGTLTMPAHAHGAVSLVIIIAGSGPTDRDCNGQGFKSDAYKKMAAQFALNGIATYRYDKRGIGKSTVENMKEEDVTFNVMIDDAKSILANFEKDTRFSQLTICGHSEGSLVGMKAVTDKHKYISLAGSGFPIGETMKEQLKGKLGTMEKETFAKLDSLQKGKSVANNLPGLESLFRPSAQPFVKSWMALNPTTEIKKIKCPILILNGTKDLQVSEKNAVALNEANKTSKLVIIPNMNHLLTEIESDKAEENYASYQKPELPISKKMMDEMILFVLKK